MSKVVFSLFVALSLFAFVSVNGQYFTIPPIPIDIKSIDFSLSYGGSFYEVGNFSLPTNSLSRMSVTTSTVKVKNNFYFSALTADEPINGTDIPFGRYLYRDDAKKLVFYPRVGTGSQGTIYRCDDKGTSSLDQVMAKLLKFIDIAAPVRNVEKLFTSREPYSSMLVSALNYSYTEQIPLTNVPGYDYVEVEHDYIIESTTQICLGYITTYRRHMTEGLLIPYAVDRFFFASMTADPMITEEMILERNFQKSYDVHYDHNVIEELFCPNVISHNDDTLVLVCPEIDLLPRPVLLDFLTSTNFSEFELVLDNPVSVENLVKETVQILNLTLTYPERVSFDGINKVGDNWSVDFVLPTDLGEALATAVDNGDIKKSELPTVAKVKKVLKKARK